MEFQIKINMFDRVFQKWSCKDHYLYPLESKISKVRINVIAMRRRLYRNCVIFCQQRIYKPFSQLEFKAHKNMIWA